MKNGPKSWNLAQNNNKRPSAGQPSLAWVVAVTNHHKSKIVKQKKRSSTKTNITQQTRCVQLIQDKDQ